MKRGWTLFLLVALGVLLFIPFGTAPTISACQVLDTPGSTYTLNQNVINLSGTCMDIRANNIVLDCADYTLKYNNSLPGIHVRHVDNVTIANCVVVAADPVSFDNYGIQAQGTANLSLVNNTIRTNGTARNEGIRLQGNQNNDSLIYNNSIFVNGTGTGKGINLAGGLYHNVSNNTVVSNGTSSSNWGIDISSDNSTVSSNTILTDGSGSDEGIDLSGDYNDVIGNAVETNGTGNDNWGINVQGDYNNIIRNRFETGGSADNYGIRIQGNRRFNLFSRNHIIASGSGINNHALLINDNFGAPDQNTFVNNNLTADDDSLLISDTTGSSDPNYLVYNNSFGEIRWIPNGSGSFEHDLELNASNRDGIGLGRNVHIGQNVVSLNSSAFDTGVINGSANISLTGIFLIAADQILKSEAHVTAGFGTGIDCTATGECTVLSYTYGKTLIFNVTGFSGYKGTDNPTTVPEFSDYAIMLILVTVVGGFLVKRRRF